MGCDFYLFTCLRVIEKSGIETLLLVGECERCYYAGMTEDELDNFTREELYSQDQQKRCMEDKLLYDVDNGGWIIKSKERIDEYLDILKHGKTRWDTSQNIDINNVKSMERVQFTEDR